MNQPLIPNPSEGERRNSEPLPGQIGRKATRKLRARAAGWPNIWFGLGLFGIVGWTVVLPPVLGALLGLWIDRNWPSQHSWVLTLLIAGLALGCVTAWQWLWKQDQ
ncbi:MAG: AtpZ/AtpI family protein [Candidatus Competibacteraceae bacterium]|nr:AtpZ/AtpI family protein [Candidatus Competibacteraceae bacterium]MBK8750391.1 AtpZ/AtpI family protein [Candidatus Competibacteraceae bacterium]